MSIVAKVPTRLETFFSIRNHYVSLSAGTRSYIQTEYVDILETRGSLAIIPAPNGWFQLCPNGAQRFIRSRYLVRYLQKRFWEERGRFTLVPVPVKRDDYPKGTMALATTPQGPIGRSYTPIAARVKKTAIPPTPPVRNIPTKQPSRMFVTFSRYVTGFSKFSLEKLQPNISFYTAPGIVVAVQDPNGIFCFHRHNNKTTPYVNSIWLVRFLTNHFGRRGRFDAKFYNHPDFDSPALVFAENLPSESSLANTSLSPVNIPVSTVIPHLIVARHEIHLYPFTPSLIGGVCLMRRGDIFAITSDPNSFLQYKQMHTFGLIHSKEIFDILKNTHYKIFRAWECNGIYFFTANVDKYKSTSSLAGFVPIQTKRIQRPSPSCICIRKQSHRLSIPPICALCLSHSKYFSLAISGDFCLLSPDPNGPYQVCQENKAAYYYIQSVFLCRFLLDKFKEQ